MIYIDLDDCVCETCESLAAFARERFDRDVAIADMASYDLRVSFSFDDATYARYMKAFHETQLPGIPETPGAARAIRRWLDAGLEPAIVTGRPAWSRPATMRWLAEHGLPDIEVLHVDKRAAHPSQSSDPQLTPFHALKSMGFTFAVEDAPNAVRLIAETGLCPCAVFTRAWNASLATSPASRMIRVASWDEIERAAANCVQNRAPR